MKSKLVVDTNSDWIGVDTVDNYTPIVAIPKDEGINTCYVFINEFNGECCLMEMSLKIDASNLPASPSWVSNMFPSFKELWNEYRSNYKFYAVDK